MRAEITGAHKMAIVITVNTAYHKCLHAAGCEGNKKQSNCWRGSTNSKKQLPRYRMAEKRSCCLFKGLTSCSGPSVTFSRNVRPRVTLLCTFSIIVAAQLCGSAAVALSRSCRSVNDEVPFFNTTGGVVMCSVASRRLFHCR